MALKTLMANSFSRNNLALERLDQLVLHSTFQQGDGDVLVEPVAGHLHQVSLLENVREDLRIDELEDERSDWFVVTNVRGELRVAAQQSEATVLVSHSEDHLGELGGLPGNNSADGGVAQDGLLEIYIHVANIIFQSQFRGLRAGRHDMRIKKYIFCELNKNASFSILR